MSLSEQEWDDIWSAIVTVRDAAPRLKNDADSGQIADAVEVVVERIVARHIAAALEQAASPHIAERISAALEDEWHEDQCGCLDWPRGCASTLKGREPWTWLPAEVLRSAAQLVRAQIHN